LHLLSAVGLDQVLSRHVQFYGIRPGMLTRPARHEAKAEAREIEAEAENFFEAEAAPQCMRPRPKPRPDTTRPRPMPNNLAWSNIGLEALTSLHSTWKWSAVDMNAVHVIEY